jgi:hypothetical protein
MVDVQDGDAHLHKRTAIPQLLNPVSSSPTKRQEPGFATSRGALHHLSPSHPARSNPIRSDVPPTGPPTFNLRAADWGQTESSPPSTVHYASSPETNGSVSRGASRPAYDSGPRSSDVSGYIMTASFSPFLCHPQNMSNSPNPLPHPAQQTPLLFYHDGRGGKYLENLEAEL